MMAFWNGSKTFWRTKRQLIVPLLLASAALLLYWLSLAPGVLPADSGEFQLVASELGVAHPPGFPLYTLLAHAMTYLPIGPSDAFRVNLLSAVLSTITLVVVYATALRLTQSQLAGLISATALGTATTFWSQSTTANIRSMTALFAALAFYVLIHYRDATDERGKRRWLRWFAIVLGLSVTHHLSLVFMAVFWVLFVIVTDSRDPNAHTRWLRAAPWVLIGLIPLLYLPLASAELRTPGTFLTYALGLGFRGDFFAFAALRDLIRRMDVMINVMTFQFHWVILVGMVFGLMVAIVRDWRLGLLLGGSFLAMTVMAAIYRAPQTVEYMLPAYIPAVLLLAYGFGTWWFDVDERWTVFAGTLLILALGSAVFQGVRNRPSFDYLHNDQSAAAYANAIFDGAPEDALVLANWHWVTPLRYLQQVEGMRPDLTIQYVAPASDPYFETWAQQVAMALQDGQDVVATNFDPVTFAGLPAAEPLGDAFLYRQAPLLVLPEAFTPLNLTLGDTIAVDGYWLDRDSAEIWTDVQLTLAWRSLTDDTNVNLFAHLVGADNSIYAQDDQPARANAEGLNLTRLRLTPRPGALPGDYLVHIGAYLGDGTALTAETGAARSPIAAVGVTPMLQPPMTFNNISIQVTDDARAYGYDWDTSLPGRPRLYVHMKTDDGYVTQSFDGVTHRIGNQTISVRTCSQPCRYVPLGQGIVWRGDNIAHNRSVQAGQTWSMDHAFVAIRPNTRDNVVSSTVIGFEDDNVTWAWVAQDDGIPALGAIPTLKWIGGSEISDPRRVTIASEAYGGQRVTSALILYDAFTNQPLNILDEGISAAGPAIPMGDITIK
jgi:hypothetical protein